LQDNKLQECFNETFQGFLNLQRENRNKDRNIMIICICSMLLQTFILVGGVLYFLNNYDVEVENSTESTTTQTIEGDSAEINNVEGNQYKDSSTHNENKN